MDHEQFRDSLHEYHDGELSPEKRRSLELHLKSCPDCAADLRRLTRLSVLFQRPAPASEEFVRAVMAGLAAEAPEPALSAWRRWLVPAMALAAAALLLALDLGQKPSPGERDVFEDGADWVFQDAEPETEELFALAMEGP